MKIICLQDMQQSVTLSKHYIQYITVYYKQYIIFMQMCQTRQNPAWFTCIVQKMSNVNILLNYVSQW